MEEKKEMDEGLFKSRSYLSCLNEGLKLPTRHILSLLRFLYPSLIAGAVVMGLWGVCFNQITVALTRWMAASEPVVLSFPLFTLIILSVLFPVLLRPGRGLRCGSVKPSVRYSMLLCGL